MGVINKMKNLMFSVAIFLTMVITIFLSTEYLSKVCLDLTKTSSTLEDQITNEKWKEAYDGSLKFAIKWKDYCSKLSVFVDHEEMDNIDHELWQLTQYTKCENKDESLAAIHVVKFFIIHINNMEKVSFQNIF